jgi:hypothetical protein
MIRYYSKGNDVVAIAEDWSANFDPNGNSEYASDYASWLAEGNIPEEWNSNGD